MIKEPETVQPGKTGGFQAEKNTAHLTGVTGLVQYECGTEAFTIKFDKPRGVAESTIEIEGEHPGLDVRLYGVEKSPELISGIVEVK